MDITRLKIVVSDAEVALVGVAIRRNPNSNGRHTGIIYRHSSGALHMVDMGWHRDCRDSEYDCKWGYYCAVPQFDDPHVEEAFADYCAHVAKQTPRQRPPYNLLSPDGVTFDSDGYWICRDPEAGMNCSSFVIAVFSSFNIPLVNAATWPIGLQQDIEEQTTLVCTLLNSDNPDDRQQAFKISPQIGKHPRIRPEETAGACLEDEKSRPLVHTQAAEYGKAVLEIWDNNHP